MPCRKFYDYGVCSAGCDAQLSFCHRYYRRQRCHFGAKCKKIHDFEPQRSPPRAVQPHVSPTKALPVAPKAMPRSRSPRATPKAMPRSRSPREARGSVARTMSLQNALVIFNLRSVSQLSMPVLTAMYHSLSKEIHPDKVTKATDNDEARRKAGQCFSELSEAHTVLKKHVATVLKKA